MPEEKKFALIVWEKTDEFLQFLKESEEKKRELVRTWKAKYGGDSYVGSIEPHMSEDGDPTFWVNGLGRLHSRHCEKELSAEEVFQNVLKHGYTGWCTLETLEALIAGKGPLVEKAMRECGFRPHKRDSNKWARIDESKERKNRQEQLKKECEEEEKKKWPIVSIEECVRLKPLMALPNEWTGLNNTYSIQVNKKGLIYVYLEINPFSGTTMESIGRFGEMLGNRGHLFHQQDGFSIVARNIRLGKEKCIYIKAVKPDNSYIESVWPSQIPNSKICDLAANLVLKVKG